MLTIISFIFGIPFLAWLYILLTKIEYQKRSGVHFKSLLKAMATGKKILIFFILLFVMSTYLLSTQGFYYSFLKPSTSPVVLIVLLVLSLSVFVSGMKFGLSMIVWTVVFSLPSLGATLFYVLLMEYSYGTLQSPDRKISLVIEYRDATLGETNYFYRFYKKVPNLPIIEKLDQEAHLMTRGRFTDHLQVLGADHAKWHKGYVIFQSETGETIKVNWEDP